MVLENAEEGGQGTAETNKETEKEKSDSTQETERGSARQLVREES